MSDNEGDTVQGHEMQLGRTYEVLHPMERVLSRLGRACT